MNDTTGYANYQQQYDSTSQNDTVSIVLFFAIIFLLFISFIAYFWYTEWHKIPIDQRGDQEINQRQDIFLLVDNLSIQVKTLFKISLWTLAILLIKRPDVLLASHQRIYAARYYHLFSLLFIITFVISLSIIIGTSNNSTLLQAALFSLVLSINLYFITRQRCYYMQKRKLFVDDAHVHAVYDTRFLQWKKSMVSNWMQIGILVIEFVQLTTFPLRDLLHQSSASFVLNASGLMPDMKTPAWYTYSLWTALAVILLSLILGILIHAINYKYPYKISTRWVRWFIPVATLLYIPLLTTFVSSAACQSLNIPENDFSSILRCHSPNIPRQTYLWLSIIGYMVAYFLVTLFLTSDEREPSQDEIAYKSISVAFIKNMGLLMGIVSLLVESTKKSSLTRAILYIVILLTMICYNIKTNPCYVNTINFFRTGSFICTLWTAALIAVLSDTQESGNLGPLKVIYIILGGWVFILLCFLVIYFIYYTQTPDIVEKV
ncbi:hypothetical protein G6F56_000052 [Rhizopus delemar]|nr:hypothetical protein G6F56_000052 [Rhizopus delemar]